MNTYIVKDHFIPNNLETEKCYINKEWWYARTLIRLSEDFPVFEVDVSSIDLGVMPWNVGNILMILDHVNDINNCDLSYPVIMSPTGWIMNGWHRVAKAILTGVQKIKAVRFQELPPADGVSNEQ